MSKFAVIKTGGKQYKVKKGDKLRVEKIDKKEGAKIAFDTLLVADSSGKDTQIGKPSLGKKTEGKILEQGQAKKISVIKFKNKTRYLRNKGHRQLFSLVEITKIA